MTAHAKRMQDRGYYQLTRWVPAQDIHEIDMLILKKQQLFEMKKSNEQTAIVQRTKESA